MRQLFPPHCQSARRDCYQDRPVNTFAVHLPQHNEIIRIPVRRSGISCDCLPKKTRPCRFPCNNLLPVRLAMRQQRPNAPVAKCCGGISQQQLRIATRRRGRYGKSRSQTATAVEKADDLAKTPHASPMPGAAKPTYAIEPWRNAVFGLTIIWSGIFAMLRINKSGQFTSQRIVHPSDFRATPASAGCNNPYPWRSLQWQTCGCRRRRIFAEVLESRRILSLIKYLRGRLPDAMAHRGISAQMAA